jgi:hypothetical protein
MEQKQESPRYGRGSGDDDRAGQAPHPLSQKLDCCPSPWQEEARRRWPHGTVLYGDGGWATVSWCHLGSLPVVSLHPTNEAAKEVKTRLDEEGCCRRCFSAYHEKLTHEVVDLDKGRRP